MADARDTHLRRMGAYDKFDATRLARWEQFKTDLAVC